VEPELAYSRPFSRGGFSVRGEAEAGGVAVLGIKGCLKKNIKDRLKVF